MHFGERRDDLGVQQRQRVRLVISGDQNSQQRVRVVDGNRSGHDGSSIAVSVNLLQITTPADPRHLPLNPRRTSTHVGTWIAGVVFFRVR